MPGINWRANGSLKPLFASLGAERRRKFLDGLGNELRVEIQNAARGKPWKRLGNAIAGTVSYQVTEKSVEAGAAHELALIRHQGGTISAPGKGPRALGRRFLTIPVSPFSRGHSVTAMRQQGWVIFRIQDMLWGYKGKGTRRSKNAILYILRRSVRHPADPWFPTEAAFFRRIDDCVQFFARP